MSRQAVEDLLTYWDECGNPIFQSAAGQLREALRADPPGTRWCEDCGRHGLRGFAQVDDRWVCANPDACERRREEQGL